MAGVQRVQDLVVWQRMYELSVEVWQVTNSPPAARDYKYRDQIRDASDSAHRHIAEGFGRYNPAEFVRFLDIARASAQETRALLEKGRSVGHLSDEQFTRLDTLAIRGLVALARLQRYLRSPGAQRNARRSRYTRGG